MATAGGSQQTRRRYVATSVEHASVSTVVLGVDDRVLGRALTVKVVRPDLADEGRAGTARRLLDEAAASVRCSVPGVVPLLDLLEADELELDPAVTVQLTEALGSAELGGPALLRPRLAASWYDAAGSGPVDPVRVAVLCERAAAALDGLHRAGWSHGDVSPGNLLVDDDDAVWLVDLGSARPLGAAPAGNGHARDLTPAVAAPEVWRGEPATAAADRYALACTVWWLLAGSPPFPGATADEVRDAHLGTARPRLSSRGPDLGAAVDAVLARGMAPDPGHRHETAAAFARDLRRVLPRTGSSGGARSPGADLRAVDRASSALDAFAASLTPGEQKALSRFLAGAAAGVELEQARFDSWAMRLLGVPAALRAAEATGVLAALAAGPATVVEVAGRTGLAEDRVAALAAVLVADGLLDRIAGSDGPATLSLAGPLAAATGPLGTGAPVAGAAVLWDGIEDWLRDGRPVVPVLDDDGAAYAEVVGTMGGRQEGRARDLAARVGPGLPAEPTVLEVGPGSGVWGLALLTARADAELVVVDRPLVLDRLLARAAELGVSDRVRVGGHDLAELGRPVLGARPTVAVAANVCHLLDAAGARRLVAQLVGQVGSGGQVVLVDSMPAELAADLAGALYGLHLALRTGAGGVHDEPSYRRWLAEAGARVDEVVTFPASPLRALVATVT